MKLKPITSEEMAAIDENAEYLGVSKALLMECAGYAVAREIAASRKGDCCVIFAGVGKNGGDGMVTARHLAGMGFKVTLLLIGAEEKIVDPNAKANWNALKSMANSIEVVVVGDSTLIPKLSAPIVVDALLGIGVKGRLRPPILQAVRAINRMKAFRVAVDVPTGIDATMGEKLGEAVKADLTVTFHRPKTGLLKARRYAGKVVVAEVGIPPEAETFAGPGDVLKIRRSRLPMAHKGDYGRLLVVGGSRTFMGAPALAGLAALQTGVDLVYVAAPRETGYSISSYSPDLITVKLGDDYISPADVEVLLPYVEKVTAVVLGPGIETRSQTAEAIKALIAEVKRRRVPLLLDADGLKIFAGMKESLRGLGVLTPHAGEFQLLTGAKPSTRLDEKVKQVKYIAQRLEAVVLLKGAVDIASDGVKVKLNRTGNPGMTVGGTGDTLAGIIGGFIAQSVAPFDAAVAGSFINGMAGDQVYLEKGYHILPTDIIGRIPTVIENPACLWET